MCISFTTALRIEPLIKTDCQRIKGLRFIHKKFLFILGKNNKRKEKKSKEGTTEIIYGLYRGGKKQLMSAGRWNQSALKPHLVSNGKNIKDYYPRRQKGHQHLPRRAQAKFRRTISQGGEEKTRSQLNTSVGAQTSVSGYFHFARD